jgi:hypothetical protein
MSLSERNKPARIYCLSEHKTDPERPAAFE